MLLDKSEYSDAALKEFFEPRKDILPMLVRDYIKQNRVIILPYKKSSRSGRALASVFHVKPTEYTMAGSFKMDGKPTLLVNWGGQKIPAPYRDPANKIKILNEVGAVRSVSNKLDFFKATENTNVRVPEFTTDVDQALAWLEDGEVFGRNTSGSCGNDIVFGSENLALFVQRPLFTKYKKKKHEFRIHVFRGSVIDIQRKAVRKTDDNGQQIDTSDIDFRIRNLANGFVFVKNNVVPPDDVIEQALLAVEAVNLDFGAVDVIYNESEKKAYVLEINSAPGLEGSTVQAYRSAIEKARQELL